MLNAGGGDGKLTIKGPRPYAVDTEKESTGAKKIFLDKTNDITLNITGEVANKAFDNCVVVDEVCPDVEFNAASE